MTDHQLLTAEDHGDLRVHTGRGGALGDAVMCCAVMPDEFRRAQGDYPILFRRNIDRDSWSALAMFGFQDGENLFLEDGRWDAAYLPLAIDIQPFLIGPPPSGGETPQVHVDMASPRIAGAEGMRLFDADRRPTPYLEGVADKLGALHQGYQGAAGFFEALRRHALIEPLALEVTLDDGSMHRLVGFHVIDEARLRALDAAALGELHADGHLMPIFMAVASLGRLNALIARKNLRLGDG